MWVNGAWVVEGERTTDARPGRGLKRVVMAAGKETRALGFSAGGSMQSKASTVAAYLKELPNERRKVMTALRALCQTHLVGFEEGIEYGMPYYKRGGQAVGIASQKNYVSIYGLRKQLAESRLKLVGAREGKGCLTFSKPESIDRPVIEKLLIAKRNRG